MKILQYAFKAAEFTRTIWQATPEVGATLADMLQPEYWAHVAKSIRPGDRIEVLAADGSWFAELFVRSSGLNEVRATVLREVQFDKAVPVALPQTEYEVKFAGAAKWRVIRRSDNASMVDGLQTRGDAEAWVAHRETAKLA